MRTDLAVDQTALQTFCQRWRIERLDLFGSALREDFGPTSDIDFLVVFEPGVPWTLFDEVKMQHELEELVGRRVDLISRRAVEESPNWIRRKAILETAEPVYVQSK